jgi:hypothetical protein
LVVIIPTKPKSASLTEPLGFLAQLTRVCEESKIIMNRTMMEDKLDGSSNFKFLEDNTLEEGLLWVIQKCDTMTTLFMNTSRGQRSARCYWTNHINTLSYALVYILFVSLS